MPTPGFVQRMAELGLNFPAEELDAFESFVTDLERAASFVRKIDRSFAEEPSNVFDPASVALTRTA
ncbi:MAG: hypothetical protein JSS43_26750 [Proteobacteria bacterium]|nr:hypothetical protein [Pseudomonadota bacterium]